ncbi:ABC transporter ATP-binding protein/permease [Ruminococcaceae bacterium OttesenSCG-928-L11]|nr:ABC transporter ATP-binding protein/permease [Ruminococcaceae bacterium OttesenSCG-928-L11]
MGKLYAYIKPLMAAMIVAIVIKGAGAITDIMIPLYMGKVIDEGIAVADVNRIWQLCAIMLGLTAVTIFLNILANYLSAKSSQGIGENLRNHLYAHIQRLRIQDVDKISTPSLITRVTNDVEHVQRTILMMSRVIVRAPVMGIGGVVLSLLIDPYLTSVIFVGMIFIGTISWFSYKATRPIFRRVQKSIDRLTTILRENLAGVRVIKSFDKTDYEIDRFDKQSMEVKSNELKAGRYHAFIGPTIALTNGFTVAAILFAGSWRIHFSGVEIGQVVTVVNYVNQIIMAMAQVPRIFMMFSRANTSANRISEVFDMQETTEYGPETTPADTDTVLEFRGVQFRYPETSAKALQNIDFQIRRGETVAVIGGTGSGKTTLLNLILRLYEPTKGEIRLQGRPIGDYTRDALHSAVTAALQQYNIFAMSIGENITLDKATDAGQLEQAASSAQLMDLVDNVEGRFDYVIAQTGSNISGGQKQRISIARTLYRQADLTVLDDVSSSLDYKTDLRLRSALRTNYKDKAMLLISQRIASVKNADRILVLDKGEMVGFGTHQQLTETCRAYREICETQGVQVPEWKVRNAV